MVTQSRQSIATCHKSWRPGIHIIDRAASQHMMGLTSRTLCFLLTANRTVETNEEAPVCINNLDIFSFVKFVATLQQNCHWECCAKRWALHFSRRQESSQLQPKTESHMKVDETKCPSGRSDQTSVNSSECRRRLFARSVTTVPRRLS